MKRIVLLFSIFTIFFAANAQKPLATFFTSGGEEFIVVMDGKKINTEPQSRIENITLDNDWAKVKIVFKNEEILPVEKTIQGKDADGNISSVTWEISQNNKGKWVVKPSSWSKIEGNQIVESTIVEESASEVYEETPAEQTTTTTQTITTTYSENPNTANVAVSAGVNNVSMSVNMDDESDNANMNINMVVPGGTVTQSQSHSQTTYTTVTTTKTTNNNVVKSEPEPDPLPGYDGRTGCSYPLSAERFETVKNSISGKDFEDSKLTVAKQVAKSNCLFAEQVKDIMLLFDFETTRLEFAKEAYGHTYDIDNYYILNDAFDFESSITELNAFIGN